MITLLSQAFLVSPSRGKESMFFVPIGSAQGAKNTVTCQVPLIDVIILKLDSSVPLRCNRNDGFTNLCEIVKPSGFDNTYKHSVLYYTRKFVLREMSEADYCNNKFVII